MKTSLKLFWQVHVLLRHLQLYDKPLLFSLNSTSSDYKLPDRKISLNCPIPASTPVCLEASGLSYKLVQLQCILCSGLIKIIYEHPKTTIWQQHRKNLESQLNYCCNSSITTPHTKGGTVCVKAVLSRNLTLFFFKTDLGGDMLSFSLSSSGQYILSRIEDKHIPA